MGSTSNLLDDTHILILMDDPLIRKSMIDLFQSMGAKVHVTENQVSGIGMYWRLFREGIRPRAVVTNWRFVKTNSTDFEFLKMIGREEIDGTSLDFLRNIADLDESAFLTIYTENPDESESVLIKWGISASVFDQRRISIEKFVARIATHEGICAQRVSEESVIKELEDVTKRASTERIVRKQDTGRFRLAC
jgi:hypothetical protein